MSVDRPSGCAYYRLLRYGGTHVEGGAEAAELDYRERRIGSLERQARSLGFEPTPTKAQV